MTLEEREDRAAWPGHDAARRGAAARLEADGPAVSVMFHDGNRRLQTSSTAGASPTGWRRS